MPSPINYVIPPVRNNTCTQGNLDALLRNLVDDDLMDTAITGIAVQHCDSTDRSAAGARAILTKIQDQASTHRVQIIGLPSDMNTTMEDDRVLEIAHTLRELGFHVKHYNLSHPGGGVIHFENGKAYLNPHKIPNKLWKFIQEKIEGDSGLGWMMMSTP